MTCQVCVPSVRFEPAQLKDAGTQCNSAQFTGGMHVFLTCGIPPSSSVVASVAWPLAVLSCKVGYANSGVANFRRTDDIVNRCEYGVWSVDRQGVSGVVDEHELVVGEPGGQTAVACLKPAGRGGGDP